ncbi:MAG: ABC transporter permease [Thermomicrobiales bacterium]
MRMLANLTWVELKLFTREPFAVIFTFIFPLITLIVITGSFGADDPAFGGATPANYYLASYIGVVIGAVGMIALPVHVATYAERGILRRYEASSIPVWSVLGAQMIVGFLMAVSGAIVLVIAGRLIFGARLPDEPFGAVVGFVIGTVSFLALGLLIAMITRNARAAQAVGMMLFFPMFLLSGAGPPRSVMSAPMKAVSDVLPLTFVVRALQDPWLGKGQNTTSLLLLIAVMLISLVVTAWQTKRRI